MRKRYQWCPVQKKVVEALQVMVQVPATVAHGFINDEMPATRSPISGKYYTSKAKLRAEYRAHGATEIGTAYDNGYDESHEQKRSESQLGDKFIAQVRDRYYGR